MLRYITVVAAACTLLVADAVNAGAAPAVNTSIGMIHGIQELNGTVNSYLGVPYAYPPVGSRRFAYAELLNTYNTTGYNATSYPDPCIQYTGNTTGVQGVLDCLKVVIWTPTGTPPTGGWPVLLYNPGGGFLTTDSNGYFGNNIIAAHQNMITVWINSRVGVEAYLSLPGLNTEGQTRFGTPTSGNFGLYDLITAVYWAKNNIAAFGGNPSQMSFGGGSAGSINTAYVLSSPLTRGMLRGAIMNAGAELPFPTDLNTQTLVGQQIANAGNCTSGNATAVVACMRALTPLQAANAYYATLPSFTGPVGLASVTFSYATLRPTVDGYVIPNYLHLMWAAGNVTRVNALITNVADEGGAWVAADPGWQPGMANQTQVQQYIQNFTANSTARQLGYAAPVNFNETTAVIDAQANALYGPNGTIYSALGPVVGPTIALADIITYNIFSCPDRRFARVLNGLGNQTWLYRYNYVQSGSVISSLGAIHGSDSYSMYDIPQNASNPQQVQLATQLSQYLNNFVVTGNPNMMAGNMTSTIALPHWPVYNQTVGLYLDIGAAGQQDNNTISPVVEPYGDQCDALWDNILWNTSYTGLTNSTTSSSKKLTNFLSRLIY